jgi:hypothetical protein
MKWLKDNGLTVALLTLFAVSVVGQGWAGWMHEAEEQAIHNQPPPGLFGYLISGAFLSAIFENWESEFLQMAVFVVFTAYLFQRGSPESKDPDESSAQDRDPALDADKQDAPWPVRAGRLARSLYSHSLGIALVILFVLSFVGHWINSTRHAGEEAIAHNQPPPGLLERIGSAEFWFESFQNWQSEFMSTAVLILLAIFLRERGSSQSKPVGASHAETGAA